MARAYKHLTYTDRLRIEKWLKDGYTYRQIADKLRVRLYTTLERHCRPSRRRWTFPLLLYIESWHAAIQARSIPRDAARTAPPRHSRLSIRTSSAVAVPWRVQRKEQNE